MNAPMMNKPPLTPDGAELELLTECAKNGIMAFPLGAIPNTMMQMAHERLVRNEWIRLIDITLVANNANRGQPELARIFKLTEEGKKRRVQLLAKAT